MIRLSERLLALAEEVPVCSAVSDVGCDHGLLAIYLMEKGRAGTVYCMDVREGPLLRARENAAAAGLPPGADLRFLLSDGFRGLSPETEPLPECAVIAGMGGKLILRILAEMPDHVRRGLRQLVLGPQSDLPFFRRNLAGAGYRIDGERLLREEGKYYSVIRALPGVEEEPYSDAECLYGRFPLKKRDRVLLDCAERDLSVLNGILSSGSLPPDREREVRERIRLIGEVIGP